MATDELTKGQRLSGDKASLQSLPSGSTPTLASISCEKCKELSRKNGELQKKVFDLMAEKEYRERHDGYKGEYIQLKKALSDLKRGLKEGQKPSAATLDVLGYDSHEFGEASEYLVANAFDRKDRAEFVKRLQSMGVDLCDAAHIKDTFDIVRVRLLQNPEDPWLDAAEKILGNILYNRALSI